MNRCGKKVSTPWPRTNKPWPYMKDELKGKYVPPYYYKYFLIDGVELPKATNLSRNMLPNSMSFSLVIIS